MVLSPQEVARLAELARIELTDEELAKLAPQLDVILESVKSVSQVASLDIPPSSHALDLTNVFRPDEVKPSWTPEQMLASAPDSQGDQFRVPRILDQEA